MKLRARNNTGKLLLAGLICGFGLLWLLPAAAQYYADDSIEVVDRHYLGNTPYIDRLPQSCIRHKSGDRVYYNCRGTKYVPYFNGNRLIYLEQR